MKGRRTNGLDELKAVDGPTGARCMRDQVSIMKFAMEKLNYDNNQQLLRSMRR